MSLRAPLQTRPSTMGTIRNDQDIYDGVARDAAAAVIRAYSSSFGLACRLLGPSVRDHVRNVYALVRLADEVVDGPMGVEHPDQAQVVLDQLEAETAAALGSGYSTNLIVHAFAATARECKIETELVTPFFASMRADLTVAEHNDDSLERYVYGSAEVVGLMCLRVFTAADDTVPYDELAPGARRLGAAFQKVNFLRDLAEDYRLRGRRYFPGVDPEKLTESDKLRLLDDIDADLAAAAAAIRKLPGNSRAAVAAAHAVFAELSVRLRATPADQLLRHRVRVPGPVKARLAAGAYLRGRTR